MSQQARPFTRADGTLILGCALSTATPMKLAVPAATGLWLWCRACHEAHPYPWPDMLGTIQHLLPAADFAALLRPFLPTFSTSPREPE